MDRRGFLTGVGTLGAAAAGGWATMQGAARGARAEGLAKAAGALPAASTKDAFFLQGWNAARDRLWQIDLWRKRGLGRLSASFGPAWRPRAFKSRIAEAVRALAA